MLQPFMTGQDLCTFQKLKYPMCHFVTITKPDITMECWNLSRKLDGCH